MRQIVLASLLAIVASTGVVEANGRPAGTSSINFRRGHESDIWVGLTFGALVSHDSGATWHWTCEDAVGYAGTWDPDYFYTASGKVFATTFVGPTINADGCTFDKELLSTTPIYKKFATSEELGPNDDIYVALNDPTDGKIYRSTDDGVTFPTSSGPGMIGDWWQSLVIAKSDPTRIYAAGYRFIPDPSGNPGNVEVYTLFRSKNAGASFEPMSQTGLVSSSDSVFEIAAVSKTEPDVVFLRITFPQGVIGTAIYRSTDAGDTWTKVLEKDDQLDAFIMRADGDAVAGTLRSGAFVAHDCGKAGACTGWTALPSPPHTSCFVENAAGELWACTQNFGMPTVPGDGYGIMKTTDLQTWTGVLKYQDIAGPIDTCDATSVHATKCIAEQWCGVKGQIGITANPPILPGAMMCTELGGDGDDDGGITQIKKPKGCCDSGDGSGVAPGAIMLSMIAGVTLFRRRRR